MSVLYMHSSRSLIKTSNFLKAVYMQMKTPSLSEPMVILILRKQKNTCINHDCDVTAPGPTKILCMSQAIKLVTQPILLVSEML